MCDTGAVSNAVCPLGLLQGAQRVCGGCMARLQAVFVAVLGKTGRDLALTCKKEKSRTHGWDKTQKIVVWFSSCAWVVLRIQSAWRLPALPSIPPQKPSWLFAALGSLCRVANNCILSSFKRWSLCGYPVTEPENRSPWAVPNCA